jgi:transcriptional regulator with XRE-family HTH domain
MTRSTPVDDAFKRKVAAEFRRAKDRAIKDGYSVEDFVKKLGITRAALHKHLTEKAIPSLRVLDKARRYWGVRLSYGGLGNTFVKGTKKDPRQAEFQFSIADISKDQIEVQRVSPKGETAVEVLIKINLSKIA